MSAGKRRKIMTTKQLNKVRHDIYESCLASMTDEERERVKFGQLNALVQITEGDKVSRLWVYQGANPYKIHGDRLRELGFTENADQKTIIVLNRQTKIATHVDFTYSCP